MNEALERMERRFRMPSADDLNDILATLDLSISEMSGVFGVSPKSLSTCSGKLDHAALSLIWFLRGNGDPSRAKVTAYKLMRSLEQARNPAESMLVLVNLCIEAETKAVILLEDQP